MQTLSIRCSSNEYILSDRGLRTGGEITPYVFDGTSCTDDKKSGFCSLRDNEHCHKFGPFAFCCVDNVNGITDFPGFDIIFFFFLIFKTDF